MKSFSILVVFFLTISLTAISSVKSENKKFIIGTVNNLKVYIVSQEKEGKYYLNPKVYVGSKLIYQDTTYSTFDLKGNKSKLVFLNNNKNHFYILLYKTDPISSDKWVILSVINNKLSEKYMVNSDIFNDIDNDGYLEIGGRGIIEGYCLNCDSEYYNPYRIYKLGDVFKFDSVDSKILTQQIYGVYLGNEIRDTVLRVLIK